MRVSGTQYSEGFNLNLHMMAVGENWEKKECYYLRYSSIWLDFVDQVFSKNSLFVGQKLFREITFNVEVRSCQNWKISTLLKLQKNFWDHFLGGIDLKLAASSL